MTYCINSTFKMLYVIAIIMIVDGHIGAADYLTLNGLLRYQNYHIALFMFTSGYFLNFTRNTGDYLYHKFSRLIVPLFVWNFIYGTVCLALNTFGGFHIGNKFSLYNLIIAPFTDGHQFIYNMASWFLVPLFFIQIISYLILKPFAKKDDISSPYYWVLFFMFALLLGFISLCFGPENAGERNIQLMFLRIFYFFPSFAFGALYKHCLEKHDTMNTPAYLCIILGLISVLCYIFPGHNHIPSWLDFANAPALAIYAISFLCILFWLRIAKTLTPIYQQSKPLQYISNHTFDIMMHHFAGFMLLKAAFSAMPNFNQSAYKTDIWYYYFPGSETLSAWLYVSITIVIALIAGFTSNLISDKIKQFIDVSNVYKKGEDK